MPFVSNAKLQIGLDQVSGRRSGCRRRRGRNGQRRRVMIPEECGAEIARAKVNLFLHVRGQQPEGYHTLESMVVFPAIGDTVAASPASGLSLTISGPFGDGLSTGHDNLTLAAAAALSDRMASGLEAAIGTGFGAALHLTKCLPVAAGIGGGSADAGAVLRLLARLWPNVPDDELHDIAFALGADAPMCLRQRPALISGVGEKMASPPPFASFWMVLGEPNAATLHRRGFWRLGAAREPCRAATACSLF